MIPKDVIELEVVYSDVDFTYFYIKKSFIGSAPEVQGYDSGIFHDIIISDDFRISSSVIVSASCHTLWTWGSETKSNYRIIRYDTLKFRKIKKHIHCVEDIC